MKDAAKPTRSRPGRPFQPKNPGKPKGARDRRTVVGIEVCRAMAARASDRLAALVDSRSHRIAFEASRLILAYAWGAPRQTLELVGDFADLSRELTAALAEARIRRAALEAVVPVAPPVAALPGPTAPADSTPPPALPPSSGSVLEAELVTSTVVRAGQDPAREEPS